MHFNAKIEPETFYRLYYIEQLSTKEVAEYFGVTVSAIGTHRNRNGLPPRGWSKGNPPFKGRKHRPESLKKMSDNKMGKPSKCYKGGYFTMAGYKKIRTEKGYMLEHRYLMEKHLDRSLEDCEIIHHINGNKSDNRIENLEIMNKSTHASLHFPKGSKFGIHAKANK